MAPTRIFLAGFVLNVQTNMNNPIRKPCPRLLFLILPIMVGSAFPPKADAQTDGTRLQEALDSLVAGFRGDAGIYVHHPAHNIEIEINADTLFPTASMIKVPILAALFQRIEEGALSLDEELTYRDSLYYPGADILGSFKDGETIDLGKVAMLMMTMSDNTASLWLQHLVGTGSYINEWLSQNDFIHTRVNSRTEGRHPDWQRYGWGQTTPREMARLVMMIRSGETVTPDASRKMYRYLTRNYWSAEGLAAVPPWVQAASKNGSVSRSKSEVVLVNAPAGDYVFCVITKNQEVAGYESDNEGFELIRTVSRLLWEAFGDEDRTGLN